MTIKQFALLCGCNPQALRYIALQYIIGAVDNVFSMEQNHDFGIDLMLKLASIGNGFAATYLTTMLF